MMLGMSKILYRGKSVFWLVLCLFFCLSVSVEAKNSVENPSFTDRINLVWQPFVDSENDLTKMDKLIGVNVVSPSWFVIDTAQGHIKNNVDPAYLQGLKEKGYQIWPLINNSFNPEMTHQWLNNPEAKEYLIRQLLFYAQRYGITGYNFDIENVNDADKVALTNFMSEVTQALHQKHIVVSMDITIESDTPNWSNCYDRKALGEIVDYLVLMAYDEHGRLSKTAGSVASLSWVESGVQSLLKKVPTEKVILGIPLYMRLWEEDPKGNVKAKTLNMPDANALSKAKEKVPVWLEDKGQFYFDYQENGRLYRVWQEDINSLNLKVQLVEKYQLAGVASWRKGFETPDIWPMIDQVLSKK